MFYRTVARLWGLDLKDWIHVLVVIRQVQNKIASGESTLDFQGGDPQGKGGGERG